MVTKKPKKTPKSPLEVIEQAPFLSGNNQPLWSFLFIPQDHFRHDVNTLKDNTKPIERQGFLIWEKRSDSGPKINQRDYHRLESMIRGSASLGTVIDVVSGLYQGRRRVSGRLVIQHCLETCEITSWYTSDPVYLMAAILHDSREDMGLSFEDVKRISGKDGVRVAQMVTVLTKRVDLKDRETRNREYMDRLAKGIEKSPWLGVIKISDRLSNLTDIEALPSDKRRTIATRTLDFYVPMALRISIPRLATALQKLSLPHVDSLVSCLTNKLNESPVTLVHSIH